MPDNAIPRQEQVCSVGNDECSSGGVRALGFCQKHYRRFKKYGDPLHLERSGPSRNLSIQVGERFGRGVITDADIRISRPRGTCERGARLLCDCGNEYTTLVTNLFDNHTRSCGCLLKDVIAARRLDPNWNTWLRKPVLAGRNSVLWAYKNQAKKRNHSWDLTEDDFDQLTSQKCFYCHRPPSNVAKVSYEGGDFVYSGIDRKDNDLGYIPENTVSCCRVCNLAKNSMSYDDFMAWRRDLAMAYFS